MSAKIWITRAELKRFIAEAVMGQCATCGVSPCECDVIEDVDARLDDDSPDGLDRGDR